MKPKEFDELIRQKFDQNDFEYNSRNWDRLEEAMDGRPKKRSIMMWWLMPVAGIAASVAVAMGVTSLMQHSSGVNPGVNPGVAHTRTIKQAVPAQHALAVVPQVTVDNDAQNIRSNKPVKPRNNPTRKQTAEPKEEKFAINMEHAIGNAPTAKAKSNINFYNSSPVAKKDKKEQEKNKQIAANEPVNTFKPEAEKKQPKLSIIISGGYSQGASNSGYAAGATIRRKISDKVFIEGDIAFAQNSIAQNMPYRDSWSETVYIQNGHQIPPPSGAGKTTSIGDQAGKITTRNETKYSDVKTNNVVYNLSYVQINPSLGYKLVKRVSLGVGPDFQQVLADNRPAPSETNPGVNQRMPLFDVGVVGKTEVSITKNVKAGVAYRKGINNALTPMGKFIDRDYMQFQVKYSIFNK